MKSIRLLAAGLAAALPASLLVATPAVAAPRTNVVAEGFDNVRGIDVGPDGMLYAAEAGTGGDECVTEGEGEEQFTICFGLTGRITQVDPATGDKTVIADQLPSYAEEDGSFASGPADVSVAPDGTIYAVIGLGGHPEESREPWGEDGRLFGHLVRVTEDGVVEDVADIAGFEVANDPDQDDPSSEGVDTNPYGLHATGEAIFVVDAGGNDLLRVTPDGQMSLVAVFPSQPAPAPPFLGMPPDSEIPSQAVPTSIVENEQGDLFVGELTGFPFPVGQSRLWSIQDDEPMVAGTGFSSVTGLTLREDSFFAVELAWKGLLQAESPEGDPSGGLVRHRPDGTNQLLFNETLVAAADGATGPDGLIYVTDNSVFPGQGRIIAFDASHPQDSAIEAACAPDAMDWPEFGDIFANTHDEAIACLAWYGLVNGASATQFDPSGTLVRGQAATMVAGLVEAAGGELPEEPADAFDDDEGNVHERAINQLAAAGILTGDGQGNVHPTREVSRAQFVALLTRSYKHITGSALPADEDAFTDDESSNLESAINAAAGAGWASGVGGGRFNPDGSVARDAASSMVARSLATYVEDGRANQPE